MNPLQVILALLTMAAGALPTVSVSFRSVAPRSSRQIRACDLRFGWAALVAEFQR